VGATQSEPPVYARSNAPRHADAPYVLLVSIDGYRYDYNALYGPENLTRFAAEGVQARSLIPGFPSDTFPNHYSIVTGMFPGTHGIVANSFFDPEREAVYRLGDAATVTDGTWYGGVPIWSAAERADMVTASYFWVGSEAEIADERPTYVETYDASVPHRDRIAQVLEWLSYPAEYRPHFITLYFSSVDSAGHDWGPESEQVRQAVLDIDEDLGSLFDGLEEVSPPVDVFIVSDHGMVSLEPDKVIDIDAHANLAGLRALNLGSKIFLYGDDPGRIETAYAELSDGAEHFRVFRAGETPRAWHANNPRFGDLIIAADAPYTLVRASTDLEFPGGAHGYDPYLFPEVRGIFYARGPDLANIAVIPSFSNVHVYPLIMSLLGLEVPADIDGRPEVLQGVSETGAPTVR
jgi:predicted AlkP superfamily pyrophosphatase or phosphodiesterase